MVGATSHMPDDEFKQKLHERFPFLAAESWEGLDNRSGNFKASYHLLDLFPKDFTTLCNLGCGEGYHSLYFSLRGHTVTSVDIEDRFQFKEELDFYHCPLEDLPEGLTFDAILISHVLEHILEPARFMRIIKSRLNPGGYLMVMLPHTTLVQPEHWWKGWDVGQLAVFLACFGFDCTGGVFVVEGYNMIGFGRKTDRPEILSFDVDEALPLLPPAIMQCAHQTSWGQHYLDADKVIYLDATTLTLEPPLVTPPAPEAGPGVQPTPSPDAGSQPSSPVKGGGGRGLLREWLRKPFRRVYRAYASRERKLVEEVTSQVVARELGKALATPHGPAVAMEKPFLLRTPDWRAYAKIPFIQDVITNTHNYETVFSMLADDASRQTFDWIVNYSFLAQLLGDGLLWEGLEPSALYKAYPGPLSIEQFHAEIEKTRQMYDSLPNRDSDIYTMWHTFVAEQYRLPGICEARQGDVVLDVGGYVGDTAVYFSRIVGDSGHVYTFECDSWLVNTIDTQIRDFQCGNVTLVRRALSDADGPIYYRGTISSKQPFPEAAVLDATSVDAWAKEHGIDRIDFIKMDIEGGEYDALQGMRESIARFRPKLAISVYHHMYGDLTRVPLLLKELCPGYRFHLSHKNAALYETILFCVPF